MKKLIFLLLTFLTFSIKSQISQSQFNVEPYYPYDQKGTIKWTYDYNSSFQTRFLCQIDTSTLMFTKFLYPSFNALGNRMLFVDDTAHIHAYPKASITWTWSQITGAPTIPTNNNQLTNGAGYITSQTTQTLTGANGITVTSGVNTFTISKTKRQETYSGTTNSSGIYSVTFGTAYSVAPNIQANIIGGTANQFLVITSVSTTGFTVNAYQRNAVTLLATEVLLASTVNVNGASVDVLITEK